MARRIIRRRRPKPSRPTGVRRSAPVVEPANNQTVQSTHVDKSPVLVATSNHVRNIVLPKLAVIDDIKLVGLADTPDNALKMLVQEHPDVVILDADFGGSFMGLDTAKMMQKTRSPAAIIMLVPDLDPVELQSKSRRFGTSWSYLKKTTAARVNMLGSALKSAASGVQWIEPDLTRPLAELWHVASEMRDTEAELRDSAA